jgi:hypothetical protein
MSVRPCARAYTMMYKCREFENECQQGFMAGNIRGFMHLDNGQESIPALMGRARGLHSSTSQLNLSPLYHEHSMDHPAYPTKAAYDERTCVRV